MKNETRDYLQFVAFLMSQNLSYAQIERIGNFLQKAAKEKHLSFIKSANFNQRFISKLAQDCFGKVINDELLEILATRPYSLIIDNSTFCGDSLCALKVKFLSKQWEDKLQADVTIIQNKVIALSNLKESSSGKTLLEIVENKLLKNDAVKKKLVGFAHNNGSSLSGEHIGLATLLKNIGLRFFDLRDPCHGLDLILKHSIKELPPSILEFVQFISNYFSYSQKKATLRRIQEENGLKILYPKRLAQTRWLSLGESLTRLLEIWDSLKKYFEFIVSQKDTTKAKKKGKKAQNPNDRKNTEEKMNSSEIKKLLNDEIFYFYILLFSHSVRVINNYNTQLQDQKLSIFGLKHNINQCYNAILEFVIRPQLWNTEKSELFKLDLQDWEVRDKIFMHSKDFLKFICEELSNKFAILQSQDSKIQDEFVSSFYDYFGRLLNSLNQYLPLEDELIKILDFVELKDNPSTLKEKIKKFCKEFNLFENEEQKQQLNQELLQLKDLKIEYYRENSENVLHMWDRIESHEKLTILPMTARLAESLPTSSATIEQSFSNIKLVKTELRNKLSELSLEGLILVGQEFRSQKRILINENMINLFEKISKEFYRKKVQKAETIVKDVSVNSQKNNKILEEKKEYSVEGEFGTISDVKEEFEGSSQAKGTLRIEDNDSEHSKEQNNNPIQNKRKKLKR